MTIDRGHVGFEKIQTNTGVVFRVYDLQTLNTVARCGEATHAVMVANALNKYLRHLQNQGREEVPDEAGADGAPILSRALLYATAAGYNGI
jgi:hypothetical protein